jgi:hypothetical protein
LGQETVNCDGVALAEKASREILNVVAKKKTRKIHT